MNKYTRLLAAAVAVLAVPAAVASDNDSKVVLVNKSAWAIHQLYFSPTSQREWGPDQLGDHTIENGDTFTLSGVPCGAYDVRLVDEDGDECIVEDVGLCADKDKWTITDKDLLACQNATGE